MQPYLQNKYFLTPQAFIAYYIIRAGNLGYEKYFDL